MSLHGVIASLGNHRPSTPPALEPLSRTDMPEKLTPSVSGNGFYGKKQPFILVTVCDALSHYSPGFGTWKNIQSIHHSNTVSPAFSLE